MLTEQEVKDIASKVGDEAAKNISKQFSDAESRINDKVALANKGLLSIEDFNKFKAEELGKINEKMTDLSKMEEAVKQQGEKLTLMESHGPKQAKSFEQFIIEQAPIIRDLRKSNKFIEISGAELKAAGVTSIAGSIQAMDTPPGSPYAPGIGGGDLEIFDIARNPQFILNHVDLGRTATSRLAWANETDYQGAPAEVLEGGPKPQTQHKFKIEMSEAKKMASFIKITEEFDEDLPGFSTKIRRMLQDDVLRGWDDAILVNVIANSTPYTGAVGLNGMIDNANLWDSLLAMAAQVRVANFPNVNTYALHPYTSVQVQTSKSTLDYWNPPFKQTIMDALVEANKMAVNFALVGDLSQYKVDIYKDFFLKIGWINDDFINNQFCIVGEIRYHRYISTARKTAIVYDLLSKVKTSLSSAGS